jgi:hypothetical protein
VIHVSLTATELLHAATTGAQRRIESIGWQSTDYVDGGLSPWDRDIEAACAELATARALGRYYDFSTGRFCGAGSDVPGAQVRWTHRPEGRLILRPRDAEDEYYVLVTGTAPSYVVVGWIQGANAKVAEYEIDPGGRKLPCWMVPQGALTPLS